MERSRDACHRKRQRCLPVFSEAAVPQEFPAACGYSRPRRAVLRVSNSPRLRVKSLSLQLSRAYANALPAYGGVEFDRIPGAHNTTRSRPSRFAT